MSLSNTDYSSQFTTLLAAHLALSDSSGFQDSLTSLVDQWLDGTVTIGELALNLSTTIAYWNQNQLEVKDWYAGTTTGGFNSDGTVSDGNPPHGGYYPLTNGVGATAYFPSVAKLTSLLARGNDAAMDVHVWFQGQFNVNEVLGRYVHAGANTTFDPTVSRANSKIAPTGGRVITITKNGSAWATVTWSAGVATGTVAVTGGVVVDADILEFVAPATTDATFGDVTIHLAAGADVSDLLAEAAASASAAAASATTAAASATTVTASLMSILEEAAKIDPNASLAQAAATISRGAENHPAATVGKAYFRVGLLTSSSLAGVATFTRATTATQTDQSGVVSAVTTGTARVSTAGQLVEEARTNLFIRSQTLAAWNSPSGGTVADNATAAPDGTSTAGSFTESGINETHQASNNLAFSSNSTNTFSTYVKPGSRTQTQLTFSSSYVTGSLSVFFNLTGSGSIALNTGGLSAGVVALSNGWYRIWATCTSNTGATSANFFIAPATANSSTYLGTSSLSLYIWGAQLELGSFPTSYVPTTTAAVPRSADVTQEAITLPVGQAFTVTGKIIAPVLAANFGNVLVLADVTPTPANQLTLYLHPGATSADINTTSAGVNVSGVSLFTNVLPSAPMGFAISVNGSTVIWSINGGAAQSFNLPGGAFSATLTKLFIGCNTAGAQQLNSTLRELNIVMRAMSAAEVAAASDVSLERDIDFTTQTYRYIGEPFTSLTELPGTTFSRATTRLSKTVAGFLLSQASGALGTTDAGLTIEPSTTNLFTNSGPLTDFGRTNITDVTDSTVSPLGTTARKLSATVTASTSFNFFKVVAATATTGSIFGKKSSGATVANRFTLRNDSTSTNLLSFTVNWDTGVITYVTGTTGAATEAYEGGWWRVSASATSGITSGDTIRFYAGWDGVSATAGDSAYFADSQLEPTSYVTSLVPTTTIAIARNPDVLTTLEAAPTSYSILVKFTIPAAGPQFQHVFAWDDGTTSNITSIYYDRGGGHAWVWVATGGINQALLDMGTVAVGSTHKIAIAVATNDVATSIDGTAVLTDVTVTLPVLTTFRFGKTALPNNEWGAGIQSIKRWRGRRTNAQLIADAT